MLMKMFFFPTKKKRRKKKIRKRTHNLQSIPLPSALIVEQRFVLVWCSCQRNKNPTASRVPTVGNERTLVALGGLYASTSPLPPGV